MTSALSLRPTLGNAWLHVVVQPIGFARDFLKCGPALILGPLLAGFLGSLWHAEMMACR